MANFRPHEYQRLCLEHLKRKKKAALFLDCGMGKTVITESHLWSLIYDYFKDDIGKVLVIAPKPVAEDTWTRGAGQVGEGDHLKELRFSKVLGTQKQRIKA